MGEASFFPAILGLKAFKAMPTISHTDASGVWHLLHQVHLAADASLRRLELVALAALILAIIATSLLSGKRPLIQ